MPYQSLIGAFACSGFSRPKYISVAKSAKLRKSSTEKRDPKNIFPSRSATEAREQNSATERRR